jgi:hypothetical protein
MLNNVAIDDREPPLSSGTDDACGLPDPSGPPQPVRPEAARYRVPARTAWALVVGGTMVVATGGCLVGMPGACDRPQVEWTEQSARPDDPTDSNAALEPSQSPTPLIQPAAGTPTK